MALNQQRIVSVEEGSNSATINRATQMRRDNDTVKNPKITLYDIDYAILYEIGENMRIKVAENGRTIDVPAIYADGETWSQIRGRGYLRDTKRKIMAPIIAIRRTSVDADDRIPTLDLNFFTSRRRFYPYKSFGNQYDRFGNQQNRKPSEEYYLVDIPTYVRVSYDVVVWTKYVEQMNVIVQAMIAQSNHMWGDSYTFRTAADSVSMNNSVNTGEDRIISSTLTLTVDGYLREEFEYHDATIQKAFTLKTVHFSNEQEQLDFYIEEPFIPTEPPHVSTEPYYLQQRNRKRNLRYR